MDTNKFVNRHIGISTEEIPSMLQAIGVNSVDELIEQTIPSNIRLTEPLNLPEPMTEREFAEHISELASKNEVFTSYIGMGWYDTVCPAPIQRNVFENPVWYTSYTPYQAEVSQGRLEALLNFQTVICELTGLPLANCSLLDEATAAAEAATMFYGSRSRTQAKAGANKLFVDEKIFPSTLAVINTRMNPQGIQVIVGDYKTFEFTPDVFGAIVQYPNADGTIEDYKEFITWLTSNYSKKHQVYLFSSSSLTDDQIQDLKKNYKQIYIYIGDYNSLKQAGEEYFIFDTGAYDCGC